MFYIIFLPKELRKTAINTLIIFEVLMLIGLLYLLLCRSGAAAAAANVAL